MLNKNTGKHLSVLLLLFFACSSLFASDERVHNEQLIQVLFGRSFKPDERVNRNLIPLQKALYLTIDLFNGATYNQGQAQRYLNDLKGFGVENLPSLSTIDFTAGWEHQRYTHRGWDWIDYPRNLRGYNFQNIWNVRQQLVLMSTIDKIFNFQEIEMIKRDSFTALLYYVHILGDHLGDSKRSLPDRMPLNGSRRGSAATRADIIWELEYHIPRLFREQTSAAEYQLLMRFIQRSQSRPSFVYSDTISDDDYRQLQAFAKEILDNLILNIPPLLENENFFRRVFF